jgi:hypothetical protein
VILILPDFSKQVGECPSCSESSWDVGPDINHLFQPNYDVSTIKTCLPKKVEEEQIT